MLDSSALDRHYSVSMQCCQCNLNSGAGETHLKSIDGVTSLGSRIPFRCYSSSITVAKSIGNHRNRYFLSLHQSLRAPKAIKEANSDRDRDLLVSAIVNPVR